MNHTVKTLCHSWNCYVFIILHRLSPYFARRVIAWLDSLEVGHQPLPGTRTSNWALQVQLIHLPHSMPRQLTTVNWWLMSMRLETQPNKWRQRKMSELFPDVVDSVICMAVPTRNTSNTGKLPIKISILIFHHCTLQTNFVCLPR